MAQSGAARGETRTGGSNTTQTRISATCPAESTAGAAREILDRCVGHFNESLRDAGGEIVEVDPDPMRMFDKVVYAEIPANTNVAHSKKLEALGIDTLEFYSIDAREDGGSLTTFAAEYEGTHIALGIIRKSEETQENRSAANE